MPRIGCIEAIQEGVEISKLRDDGGSHVLDQDFRSKQESTHARKSEKFYPDTAATFAQFRRYIMSIGPSTNLR